MKKKILLLLLLLIVLKSCSPKIRTQLANNNYTPLPEKTKVFVIEMNEKIPEGSDFIGDLKIGDSGFSTDCGYTKVIDEAKKTAQNSGANLVYITEIKKPNFGSTCYRIKAKLFRNINADVIANFTKKMHLKNQSRLPANSDYALVHFYRPKNYMGSLIGYKVRMNNDSIIGRVRNGEKFTHKITKFGRYEFWGVTESKTSVILNIAKGQEYFVRCGVNLGFVVGKPEMYLVENNLGISEYESLK